MPARNPITAGRNASLPIFSDCSIDGISRLYTEAAVITPAAKPVSILWKVRLIFFFIKNTQAEPRAVAKNGIIKPCIT